MKLYQVHNPEFAIIPHKPFETEQDAVAYIKALQETYDEVFHVIELNVVSSVMPPRKDQ